MVRGRLVQRETESGEAWSEVDLVRGYFDQASPQHGRERLGKGKLGQESVVQRETWSRETWYREVYRCSKASIFAILEQIPMV